MSLERQCNLVRRISGASAELDGLDFVYLLPCGALRFVARPDWYFAEMGSLGDVWALAFLGTDSSTPIRLAVQLPSQRRPEASSGRETATGNLSRQRAIVTLEECHDSTVRHEDAVVWELQLSAYQLRFRFVEFKVLFGSFGHTCNVAVGSSRVDLQACKLEYSIVSPK